MNREVAVLILLVALLAIVLLCVGTGSTEADPPVETDLPSATHKTTNTNSGKGIVWANWQERDVPGVETPATPVQFDDPAAAGIPADVRAKLARDYKGMDVYVSRGAGHE